MSEQPCSQCGLRAFENGLCAACSAGAFALAALGGRRPRTRRSAGSKDTSLRDEARSGLSSPTEPKAA